MINSTSSESQTSSTRSTPRLHRSMTDSVLAGVCGGLGEYLGVDPSLVRLAFVVATLWGGIGLLAYVVLAIVLPMDQEAAVSVSSSGERSHLAAGLLLVAFGGLLLVGNLGLAPWLTWNLFWPGILILIGVGLLVGNPRSTSGG